ncbi:MULTISPECIES: hypothetical protein [unclassified Streptomyces]|uniref:hypothetical protein n=1 Tax=unclassified Streptomyces TaxID=2593676 RepID=UPI002251D2C7|nr:MULTISPECIES: hypothetical protein [unclassified Streptomyces]MCX4647043.1 hypothetical protein [Streptomyces sp. NBC_01446]MCX5326930.1 hypothetical protein [Streptomyces sp. NBC_00120]
MAVVQVTPSGWDEGSTARTQQHWPHPSCRLPDVFGFVGLLLIGKVAKEGNTGFAD